MVYFVVNRFQIGRLKSIVRENDPSAFIAISEVADVLGSTIQNEPARTDSAAPGSSSEDHSE
jgi:uncharacterized membrane-anchored protein YitT (DUF2179 family)